MVVDVTFFPFSTLKECNKFKFGIVSFLDHKDLLEYLSGNKDKSEFTSKDRGFRIAAPMAVSSAGDATAGMSGGLSFQALASATGGSKRGREDEDEEAAPPPPLSQSESTGASRPYSLGGLDDDEEEAASPVSDAPLTEAQIRVRKRMTGAVSLTEDETGETQKGRNYSARCGTNDCNQR